MASPPASSALRRIWRSRAWPAWGLWPLSLLYGAISGLQRALYRSGLRASGHAGLPTIVIGNVIAGGAGKTPVTLATVQHLQRQGWRPGIISRGYGRSTQDCRAVHPDSHPLDVGDEPLLLAHASQAPVFVARQRLQAAQALRAAHPEVNLLVCDDGLQHYALARDIAVCVFNDAGIGNGWLLPAGPLRQPWPSAVDAVVHAGPPPPHSEHLPRFALQRSLAPYALDSQGQRHSLAQLAQAQPLWAVAAIARPEEFFDMLRAQGLPLADAHTQALADHDNFAHFDAAATRGFTVLCTEKDAAKLWPHCPQALAVPLQVALAPGYFDWLDAQLQRLSSAH